MRRTVVGIVVFAVVLVSTAQASASEYIFDRFLNTPGAYGLEAVPGSGDFYTTTWGNWHVERRAQDSTLLNSWGSFGTGDGQFNQPWGVATDSTGAVYVADRQNNRIQKFTASGTFVTKWGTAGSGNGQFSLPLGIDVDAAGYVYVTDVGNNRVQKFDSAGNFVTAWGSFGSGNGQFLSPHGIGVDSSGIVYVGDSGGHRIQKFDSTGTFLVKWGSAGTGPGQFSTEIYGVALDSSGNVYTVEKTSGGSGRMQKFSSTGTLLDTIDGAALGRSFAGTDVAVGDDDSVLLGNESGNVQRYLHRGSLTIQISGSYTGNIDFTVGGGLSPSNFSLNSSTPSRTFVAAAGTYPVSASSSTNQQTGASCSDGSDPANVSLSLGEQVTCTYSFTRLGTLVVKQNTQPKDPQDFTFNAGGGLSPATFQLDDDNSAAPLSDTQTFSNVQPGTYSVSQTTPAGWAPAWSDCSDGSATTNIDVALGETVTCTFHSHPPDTGLVLFHKDSRPDSSTTFVFSGLTFPVVLNDDGHGTPGSLSDPPNEGGMYVRQGTYSLSEGFVSGWNLSSAFCSDGSPVWALVVSPEEVVTCTFVNDQMPTGRVIVKLVDDPAYSATGFGFTAGGGLNGAQYPSTFTLARSVDPEYCFPKCPPDNDTKLFQIPAGPGYSITESTVPSGWELISAACDDGSPISDISVSSGETVTCTFTNRKLGSLRITQDTQPDDPHDFSYDVTGPSSSNFVLDDDGDDGNGTASSRTLTGISPGTYSVAQASDPGWSRFYGYCSDGSPISNVSISSGESVTCRFGNTPAGQPAPGTSIGAGGVKGNGGSSSADISSDGRLAAFVSVASNLTGDDPDVTSDIFLRNLRTGEVRLVSRANGVAGVKGNRSSGEASISADGRYVAFTSNSFNLDPADVDSYDDVYVRDVQLGTTTLVSRATGAAGAKGTTYSHSPTISDNGRYVTFTSQATNFDPADTSSGDDIYVRDLQTNTTTLVSRATGVAGAKANNSSIYPSISGDGRYVTFASDATNLDPADSDTLTDVYVRDLQTATTTLVSRATGAAGAKGNAASTLPSISANGRYVGFQSSSVNLDPVDATSEVSVFVRDLQSNSTEVVSRADGTGPSPENSGLGASISTDGRYVTFQSFDSLDPSAPTTGNGIFVRDRQANTTRLRSLQTGADGDPANSNVSEATTSDDGRYTAFTSLATNLSPDDTVSSFDIYVRDSQTNVVSLESRASPTYPRAKGATPIYAPLVPAYADCGSTNRAHAPPLSFNSCAPPGLSSPRLTVGTPDANGQPAGMVASVQLKSLTEPLPLNPDNGDQSDVALDVSVTDVRNASGLTDYTGELEVRLPLQVTDRINFPPAGGMGPGTTTRFNLSFSVPCSATGATTVGSTCSSATTAEAVLPGAVVENSRGIWDVGQIQVYDGGTDNDGDTTADDSPFLRQGVFVP